MHRESIGPGRSSDLALLMMVPLRPLCLLRIFLLELHVVNVDLLRVPQLHLEATLKVSMLRDLSLQVLKPHGEYPVALLAELVDLSR